MIYFNGTLKNTYIPSKRYVPEFHKYISFLGKIYIQPVLICSTTVDKDLDEQETSRSRYITLIIGHGSGSTDKPCLQPMSTLYSL